MKGFIFDLARRNFQAFAFGNVEELLEKRADLTRRDGVDAESAAGIDPILIARGVGPGAHENPKIAASLITEEIFPVAGSGFIDIAKEEVAALGERGDEASLVNASVILSGKQHAGVAGMERKGQHFAADRSDA